MFGFTATAAPAAAAAAAPPAAAPAKAPTPAPAQAGFGFGASPAAASTATAAPAMGFGAATTATATPLPSNTGFASAPAATTTSAPSAAAPAAKPTTAAPAAAEAPPPPSYARLLDRACREGAVSDAFVQEVRKRFSAPMEVKATPPAAAATATAANTGGTASATSTTAPSTSALARNTEAQQQQQVRQLQVENAQKLLQLLMMCDSGFNNSEVESGEASTASEEAVKGLHASIGAVAASAASNLIAFVKAAVVKHTQALDGETTSTVSLFADNRRKPTYDDPTLLAAQCLYLLSRHFQLTASVAKEALGLVETFYFLLKNALRSRLVPLAAFSESNDTSALNTLTWLCVFSVVNMVAVWKKLRSAAGELRPNELIQSSVNTSIDATVNELRKRLRESVQSAASAAAPGVGSLYGGAPAAGRGSAVSLMQPAVYTWQVIVDSYLSILTLAQGCLLRAKGSDQGYDKALDAFLGERVAVAGTSGGVAGASSSVSSLSSAASLAVHRGKVTKRMVEVAPMPRTLAIPTGLLYIAPYEMMSYLFDEMLPLLRHLSELEVATHRRYIEQLEELPRISTALSGGNQNGFHQRSSGPGLQRGGDGGEDGWLHRMTRVGLHGAVVGEPFTSEMAHLLEALAICLQHLPPEVLNPDLDADCAATFFIFKNFVKHMRQVFATQRSGDGVGSDGALAGSASAVWENYTLKLMTKFLEVLAMIGRNPQYTQRVVVLLTDAQTECGELQWHSLVTQALECAGFNSGLLSVPNGSTGGGSGMSLSAMASAAAASPSALQHARGGAMEGGDDTYAATSTVVLRSGVSRALHRQFTRLYARKCQRQFISSFFLLLRQLFAHPTLRPLVSSYINLEFALTFLFAPQQSQVMLGSTLSLISALVSSASDAQLVWTFLEQRQLLQLPSMRSQRGSGNAGAGSQDGATALYDRFTTTAMAGGYDGVARESSTHEETLSLIGHCQYESTQGTYDITIGFLHLVTALFQNDQPSMAALNVYTTVTNFIAQEVLRGVLKRVFAVPHERYTVFALAAAALRQALLVRFHGENGRTTMLPFANVMAINKAPADVVGEVVRLVFEASDAPYELPSHHRAAVRQALHLLITAIQTVQEQKAELLLFDTRTTLNTDLAVRVLGLCSLQDTLLTKMTLQLLLLFPVETANQAAHYWSGLNAKYAPVLDSFAQLLHPLSTVPVVVQAPPELAQLDLDPAELVPGWTSALLIDTKSLLLDLLMHHADVTQPSLTAWMCGFYHEEYATRGRSNGGGNKSSAVDGGAAGTDEDCSWWRTTLLTSVVEGACSKTLEQLHPALAVKCVKLLYLLRANRLYGALVVRPFLETVCQTLFLRLQHFRASACTPVALSKYAYVLKLLALEACYTYRTSPNDLRVAQSTSIPSISVEVLLSLLYPYGSGGSGALGAQSGVAEEAVRVAGAALESSCFAAGSFVEGGSAAKGERSDPSDARGERRTGEEEPSGAMTIMSRDAAVDITSWLPQALQVLPAFPEKLPSVSGGRSHLVPCAADGVVQYNMASLYEAFQLDQARANKPSLTMAELRDKLQPFIAANDCFFSYAAGVSFVEGWCQLVSVACSVVQGLSMSRLRAFALCILRGLDATTAMTAAAQEQVCTRLCHCLSTVVAHLRKTTLLAADRLSVAAAHAAEAEWSRAAQHNGSTARPSGAHVPRLADGGEPARPLSVSQASAIGKRRAREDEAPRHATESLRPLSAADHHLSSARQDSNPFATQVGETSNFYSAAGRAQLTQALLQRRQGERVVAAEAVAANAVVLQPLVHALVQWGTRIPGIRAQLYMSMLCLAETPGINLDDAVLWRSQKALLSVICADICDGCEVSHAAATRGTTAAAAGGVGGVPGTLVSGGTVAATTATVADVPAPQVQQAVALLVALLQSSAPIRDDFCNATTGSEDGMGPYALRCTAALLQSVDSAVCSFFTNNGAPLGSLLWQIRSTFDLLSVVSLGHASQVLHSDLLRPCFAMQAWSYSTQVVLGYTQAPAAHNQMVSKPLVEQNKEVLRRLLLGVVRWVNLLLSSLGDATPLLYEVQKFIRDHRTLIDYVFISPAAVSSTVPGSARLSGSHLTLCAELSECLRALSSSVLAVDCRALVDSMALPDLLNMLSSDEMWRRGPSDLYDFADVDSVTGGLTAGGARGAGPSAYSSDSAATAGYDAAVPAPMSGVGDAVSGLRGSEGAMKRLGGPAAALSMAERGRDVVALTVRNLAHLLLNAEYGLRGTDVDAASTRDGAPTPMLRYSVNKRNLCLHIVRHVAHSLSEIAPTGAHPFRLECYLYALHALVCLLHSFVLPLDLGAPQQRTADDFLHYLQGVSLQELVEALTQAHDAVYALKRFNTDYRGGVRVHRLDARHPWAAVADGDGAAGLGSEDAATQSLSNGMRPTTADADAPQATPKSTPALHHGEAFSVPSTPGLLPAPEVRRNGRSAPPKSAAGSGGIPQGSPGAAAPSAQRNTPSTQLGKATSAAAGHARDPHATVVMQRRSDGHGGDGFVHSESASPLPATESGEKVDADNTLWNLLPSSSADGANWTRVYESFQSGGALASDLSLAVSREASQQWADVLNVENEVRQIKVAIANALRATKGAMGAVSRMQ